MTRGKGIESENKKHPAESATVDLHLEHALRSNSYIVVEAVRRYWPEESPDLSFVSILRWKFCCIVTTAHSLLCSLRTKERNAGRTQNMTKETLTLQS